MSITSLPRYDMPSNVSTTPTLGGAATLDINSVTQWIAAVFMMPEEKIIDRVFFRVNTAASASCTVRVTIEEINPATGEPNGTILVGPTDVTVTNSVNDYLVFFSTPATITKGKLCCVRIAGQAGTPSAVNIGVFSDDNAGSGLPYCIDFDTTATLRDNLAPNIGVGASDGSTAVQIKHFWPISSVTTETFNSSSTPDTIGNRMVVDVPVRFCGAKIWLDADAAGTIKLYDKDGSTVLTSTEISATVPPSTVAYVAEYIFTGSANLTSGTYWLALEATTATGIGLSTMTFPNAQWRNASPLGGGSLTYATCTQTPTSTGSWTVNTSKQAFLAPIFDGFEAGGGGETSHVFIG